MDYFVHVLSGKKTWRTTDGTWIAEKGQTLFFKKGAAIVYQDFKDDFCVLVFFVSDNFIRDVVREVSGQLSSQRDCERAPKRRDSSQWRYDFGRLFSIHAGLFHWDGKAGGNLVDAQTQGIDRQHTCWGATIPSSPAIFNRCSKAMRRRCRKSWRRIFVTTSRWKISRNYPTAVCRPSNATSRNTTTSPRQVAIAKATGLLSRAAKKSRAQRFASRLGLRLRRPLAFQPGVQGKIRHLPGELPQRNSGRGISQLSKRLLQVAQKDPEARPAKIDKRRRALAR